MAEIIPSSLPLETLSETYQAPKLRVKTASDAQTIVNSVIFANRERARFSALLKGMMDGNPPYNRQRLRQNAQAYKTNINFREGGASLRAALVPYYDLFAGSKHYAEVDLDLDNPDDREYKSAVVTEEFDALLKGYPDFIFHMHAMLHDLIAYGRGHLIWSNTWGWHFQSAAHARVYVPDSTKASLDSVEIMVVREKYELHKLWGMIADKKTATSVGWDTQATAEAIRSAIPEERTTNQGDSLSYEYVQQRMKDRDLAEGHGAKQPTVQAAHLLVKEFDGTVTHMIVLENGGVESTGKAAPASFLFNKRGEFENFRQFTAAFFLEIMDGSWNGATGIGHEIYSSMEIKNRLLCKAVDNAFLSSSITLQAIDAASLQKTNLIQAGDLNILPPGYNMPQSQTLANSEPLYMANRLVEQTVTSNTGIYRAKMEQPQGNPRTAKEVEINFQNATTLSNSGQGRFYQQMDFFYPEVFRRVTVSEPLSSDKSPEAEAVRKFFYCCAKRGVTREDLKKVASVRAVRNIGNGSQTQREQVIESFTPFVGMLPESGKQNWMNMLIAAKLGSHAVNALNPPRDRQLLPNDQQAWAVMENSAMKEGNQPLWTPSQNNVIHATEHMKAMAGAAQSMQQGGDAIQVLSFMEMAGPHTLTHLTKMQSDPSRKSEYKMLSDQFAQLAKFTTDLHNQVQQQQQEQQQAQQEQMQAQQEAQAIQNGTDPDTQVKMAKAAADAKIKEAKTQHSMALKDEQHRQRLTMNDLAFSQKLRNEQLQNTLDVLKARKELQTTATPK